jgi:hypothetical protein
MKDSWTWRDVRKESPAGTKNFVRGKISSMAAAVTALHQHQKSKRKVQSVQSTRGGASSAGHQECPVSFHLQLHLGAEFKHEGMNSVQLLRVPLKFQQATAAGSKSSIENEAGTKFEVLTGKYVPNENTTGSFVTELLIATEKRIFIVASSDDKGDKIEPNDSGSRLFNYAYGSKSLEIIDSIPMEEIETISFGKAKDSWEHDHADTSNGWISELIRQFIERFSANDNEDAVVASSQMVKYDEKKIEAELDGMLGGEVPQEVNGFLKITTTKEKNGFNGGRPYYFMIKNDTYRSLKKQPEGGESDPKSASPEISIKTSSHDKQTDLQRVYGKLQKLITKRRKAFIREHGFQLLQGKLQEIWDSIAFNILVLILIVSNFIFTVQQLENKDPSLQRYFETIDLAYTVIFCIGSASRSPPNRNPVFLPRFHLHHTAKIYFFFIPRLRLMNVMPRRAIITAIYVADCRAAGQSLPSTFLHTLSRRS